MRCGPETDESEASRGILGREFAREREELWPSAGRDEVRWICEVEVAVAVFVRDEEVEFIRAMRFRVRGGYPTDHERVGF